MDERSAPLDEFTGINSFIDRFGQFSEDGGMPRTAGYMFALLLTQGEPISFSELAKRLQVSRGGVSTNARLLEEMGMIERVTRAGDRQDYFQVPPDAWRRQIERRRAVERKARQAFETLLGSDATLSEVARARLTGVVALLDRSDRYAEETLDMIADGFGT